MYCQSKLGKWGPLSFPVLSSPTGGSEEKVGLVFLRCWAQVRSRGSFLSCRQMLIVGPKHDAESACREVPGHGQARGGEGPDSRWVSRSQREESYGSRRIRAGR